jgi:hypothetical protein
MGQATRSELVEQARNAVRTMFELRRRGASGAELARASGFADGFMRSLVQAHLCSERELLELVRGERQRLDGPAARVEASGVHLEERAESQRLEAQRAEQVRQDSRVEARRALSLQAG